MKEAHSTLHRPASMKSLSRLVYGPLVPAYRTNVALRTPQPEHVAVNTRGACVSFLCPGYVLVGVGF